MAADQLLDVLLGRARNFRSTPPVLPRGFEPVLPDEDQDHEDAGAAEVVAECISLAVAIRYVDAKGQESSRRITIRRVDRRDDVFHLSAFCHERQAVRSFRADRIQELIDIESGELFDSPTDALKAIALLHEEQFDTPEARDAEAIRRCRHGLNVLVFLARCDGQMHPSEFEVINHYLLDRCFDLNFDGDAIMDYAHRLYPDAESFQASLRAVARNDLEELTRIARCAQRLIAADGAVTDEEFEFAARLGEAMS